MKSAAMFMGEFFRDRTLNIHMELANRAEFRSKYFKSECLWDRRSEAVARSESEAILEISQNGNESVIITKEQEPFPKLKYHLVEAGETWQIQCVDVACLECRGISGLMDCIFCRGIGWHKGNEAKKTNNCL